VKSCAEKPALKWPSTISSISPARRRHPPALARYAHNQAFDRLTLKLAEAGVAIQ